MEQQLSFADSEYSHKRHQARKEKFLARMEQPIPDHTTIMNFRHLLERHGLGRMIFQEVNDWLIEAGVLLKEGTLSVLRQMIQSFEG